MPLTETVEADDVIDQASSQGDTEPLEFDTEADAEGEMEEEHNQDQEMLDVNTSLVDPESVAFDNNPQQLNTAGAGETVPSSTQDLQDGDAIVGQDEDAEADFDVDEEVDGDHEEDAVGSYEDEAVGIDELAGSQATTGNISPSKSALGGANFSDESDLTDEPDEDDENDEDAEGEEEDEEEGDEEEGEEDDDGDEDEAAKGLAALTSRPAVPVNEGELNASSIASSSGLDGLAIIASAEAGEESQGEEEEDTDNDSIAGSHARGKSRRLPSAIPRRTATRLNEVIVASPQISEDDIEDDDEEEEEAEEDDEEEEDQTGPSVLENAISPSKSSREMSSIIALSGVARRNTKPGAAGLLAGAPSITVEGINSGAPSAATSREATPRLDEGEDGTAAEIEEQKDEIEQGRDEVGTPAQDVDEVQAEDEPTTDEAALRRQEAMEALTKIEIGFALLRDKLYIERMEEVSKEGEMILDGTHPDLIHLSNLIEVRRERKLNLVEKWFEQEEKQYDRVAKAEEAAAWNNWRNEVVELRREQMNDAARKRRKLDREKRALDGPRPARRHQVFETELLRNPDYDRKLRLQTASSKRAKHREDGNEMGAYVAFPDLRGADDHESWMDMERMGIATDPRMAGMGPGFYRPEEIGMDPYAMYAMEQQAPPGSSTGFDPYGVAPPPSDFAAYERAAYEGRHNGQQQAQQHSYAVDSHGRPISPPPLNHNYTNATQAQQQQQQQRNINRGADPYTQIEPSHHSQNYNPSAKAGRRSPHPVMDERDVKHFVKPVDNALPIRASIQRLNSPPSSYQNVRPIPPPPQTTSSRPTAALYAKHGNHITEEGFYDPPSNIPTNNVMKASSLISAGPPTVSSRPKMGLSGPDAASYLNRRPQEHLFPR